MHPQRPANERDAPHDTSRRPKSFRYPQDTSSHRPRLPLAWGDERRRDIHQILRPLHSEEVDDPSSYWVPTPTPGTFGSIQRSGHRLCRPTVTNLGLGHVTAIFV